MSSKIKFNDLSYIDRRRKYRQYVVENGFAYEMKLFIMDEIVKDYPIEFLPNVNTEHFVNVLLIDGYVSYERVFDSEQKSIIEYSENDPNSFILNEMHGKKIWIQYNDNPDIKRILTDEQILYISYPVPDANDSLIGQLYTKQVKLYNNDKLNDFMISYIVKKVKIQLDEIIEQERNFFKNK